WTIFFLPNMTGTDSLCNFKLQDAVNVSIRILFIHQQLAVAFRALEGEAQALRDGITGLIAYSTTDLDAVYIPFADGPFTW
ncbi:hypothetical protein, partial [Culturomica massiliensis]